jgi:2-keto-4-pentenoate hydratase
MSTVFSAPSTARWLHQRAVARMDFAPLSGMHLPPTMGQAYEIADELVRLRGLDEKAENVGYKIALTTPQMRAFVGYHDSIAGKILSSRGFRSGAAVSSGDFVHMAFECEIAFLVAKEITLDDAASIDSIAHCIEAAAPAFELVDDMNADYSTFAKDDGATLKSLAAGNAWNHGVVLGAWQRDWQKLDLASLHGQVFINGKASGEGYGRDVMGHPLEAMCWIAKHLLGRGKSLLPGDFVITGSLITTKFPIAGDSILYNAGALGEVSMSIVA